MTCVGSTESVSSAGDSGGAHGSDDNGPSTDGDGAHGGGSDGSVAVQEGNVTLGQVLEFYGRQEEDTPKDNNCLFHALVKQLGRVKLYHGDAQELRQKIVDYMREKADVGLPGRHVALREFVDDEPWDSYLDTMAQHGRGWGDELALRAASEGPHRAHRVPNPNAV